MRVISAAISFRHLSLLALLTVFMASCGNGAQATGGTDKPSDTASVPATGAETSASVAAQSETSPGSSTWPVGGAPLSPSATAGSATAASANPR